MFHQSYRNTLDRDGKGKKGSTSCILPFFGFRYGSDTDSYTQGVYISDSNEISGQRKVYGTHSLEVEVFSRSSAPTGRAKELEDKFISLAKARGYENPWNMPYIPTSLRDYYNNNERSSYTAVGCFLSIVPIILWFVLYRFTFPPVEARFGYNTGCVVFVFGIPIAICVGTSLLGGIVDLIRKLVHKAPPKYCDLTSEQRAAAREKYFAHMVDRYGSDAGAVLKEYAILKGYDRF